MEVFTLLQLARTDEILELYWAFTSAAATAAAAAAALMLLIMTA